jgi:hypothetical protein
MPIAVCDDFWISLCCTEQSATIASSRLTQLNKAFVEAFVTREPLVREYGSGFEFVISAILIRGCIMSNLQPVAKRGERQCSRVVINFANLLSC